MPALSTKDSKLTTKVKVVRTIILRKAPHAMVSHRSVVQKPHSGGVVPCNSTVKPLVL